MTGGKTALGVATNDGIVVRAGGSAALGDTLVTSDGARAIVVAVEQSDVLAVCVDAPSRFAVGDAVERTAAPHVWLPREPARIGWTSPRAPLWTGKKWLDLLVTVRHGEVVLVELARDTGIGAAMAESIVRAQPPTVTAAIVSSTGGATALANALQLADAMAAAEDVRARGGDALLVVGDVASHHGAWASLPQVARATLEGLRFDVVMDRAGARGGGSVTVVAFVAADAPSGALRDARLGADRIVVLDARGGVDLVASGLDRVLHGGPRRGWGAKIALALLDAHDDGHDRLSAFFEQPARATCPVGEQVLVAYAILRGYANGISPAEVPRFEQRLVAKVRARHPALLDALAEGVRSDGTGALLRRVLEDPR